MVFYNGPEMTYSEAHRRISEAEQGFANNNVVPHCDVMKHSYEVLKRYLRHHRNRQ